MDCDTSSWTKSLGRFRTFTFSVARKFFITKVWTEKQNSRGYAFFEEGYIHDVYTHQTDNIVKAKCYRSQKKNHTPHSLSIHFSLSMDSVIEAHCTCEAGNSESCNHLVALAFFLNCMILRGYDEIPENPSCTSLPMEWNKPRGKKLLPEPLAGSVFHKPTNKDRKKDPVKCIIRNPIRNTTLSKITASSVHALKKKLNATDPSIGFAALLSPEDMSDPRTVHLGDNIYVPQLSFLGLMAMGTSIEAQPETQVQRPLPFTLPLDDKEMVDILISLPPVYHPSLLPLSMKEVAEIEASTRDQSLCTTWKDVRRFRFTASKFGYICKRKLFNASFIKQFVQPDDISHVRSVAHGLKNESVGRAAYLDKHRMMEYFPCGFVIHPYASHLGATPDGIVYDKDLGQYGILEIKCPYTTKVANLAEYAKLKTCMKVDENNVLKLKITHDYYFQVQGQMLLSGLRWADFVIFLSNSKEITTERIIFDPLFCQNMYEKLTKIYEDNLSELVVVNVEGTDGEV